MAIPNIIRERGGIVDLLKRGKYKDSLPSPLDPPLAGGGGGGGWGCRSIYMQCVDKLPCQNTSYSK